MQLDCWVRRVTHTVKEVCPQKVCQVLLGFGVGVGSRELLRWLKAARTRGGIVGGLVVVLCSSEAVKCEVSPHMEDESCAVRGRDGGWGVGEPRQVWSWGPTSES